MSLPLCVDLDGTLVHTDLVFESAVALLRTNPWLAFALPVWLARGKAYLKREIALRIQVNAALLPYNRELVQWISEERERGRATLLVTGSDESLARAVAKHVAIFDSIIGSDGSVNRTGETKLQTLAALYRRDFAYAGNSRSDLAVWKGCAQAVVVNASPATESAARALGNVVRVFAPRKVAYSQLRAALRPRISQVILTACIVPAMVTGNPLWAASALAVCCLLTGGFLIRDMANLDRDRATPSRADLPLASGAFPLSVAFFLAPALVLMGIAGMLYIAARNAG